LRLLLVSDLHCDSARTQTIAAAAAEVDVVICAGDLANMHRGLEGVIAILSRIAAPTLLVPGNNETRDELVEACSEWPSARVLHGESATIGGVTFFGLGGGVPDRDTANPPDTW